MRSDIDQIMQKNGIDAILVMGSAQNNPSMYYFTGPIAITRGDLIKVIGSSPVLFHVSIEREEAKKSGLQTIDYAGFNQRHSAEVKYEHGYQRSALFYKQMLAHLGITSGKIAIFGQCEIGSSFRTLQELIKICPEIEIGNNHEIDILLNAMATKEAWETIRIKNVGEKTTRVVGKVADFLSSQSSHNGYLILDDGNPITISHVKKLINLWCTEEELENPEGIIFAMGHDAGVPHNSGKPEDMIRTGVPIVFDIFPREINSGYHFDFTRTWCLGSASDEILSIYNDVYSTYCTIVSSLKPETLYSEYHKLACDLFREMGHNTIIDSPNTINGYVHGIGHGVGLRVHEKPSCGGVNDQGDYLLPGSVFTIEPGLYYPEKNIGIRLEDTYFVSEKGKIEKVADYPLDMVLPIRK